MLTESQDEEQITARVAALDIGKAELVCCVRVPAAAAGKKRLQEVSTHSTMTRAVTELANHLVEWCAAGGDGGDQRLLEACVLPARGARTGPVAGQCPRRQTPARSTQNRLIDRTIGRVLGRVRATSGSAG